MFSACLTSLAGQSRLAIRALASVKAIQEHEVSQQTCSAVREARVDPSLAPGSSDSCTADPLSGARLHLRPPQASKAPHLDGVHGLAAPCRSGRFAEKF